MLNGYKVGDYISDYKLKQELEENGFNVEINLLASSVIKTRYEMVAEKEGARVVFVINSIDGTGTMIEQKNKNF